jgi:hypothetical protein
VNLLKFSGARLLGSRFLKIQSFRISSKFLKAPKSTKPISQKYLLKFSVTKKPQNQFAKNRFMEI